MVGSPVNLRALSAGIGVLPLLATLLLGAAPSDAEVSSAAHPSRHQAARASQPEPLQIDLSTISPSVVPQQGPIRLAGTVTNIDDETWSTINLYPFISSEPMRTEADLAAAVLVPVDQEVGSRIAEYGPLETIPELAPGQKFSFSFVVPRSYYTVPRGGIYWFGVHALGEGPAPRDLVADGRARTFLPYVPAGREGAIRTALVVPLRRYLAYEDDGSLAGIPGWTGTLQDEGQLRATVDFGTAAGSDPVTWLVDPALPDAVGRLAVGNPGRSLEPTVPPAPTPQVYVVAKGDTMSKIAKRFGLTMAEVMAANPQIKNPNKIAIGDQITIPVPVGDGGGAASGGTVPSAESATP